MLTVKTEAGKQAVKAEHMDTDMTTNEPGTHAVKAMDMVGGVSNAVFEETAEESDSAAKKRKLAPDAQKRSAAALRELVVANNQEHLNVLWDAQVRKRDALAVLRAKNDKVDIDALAYTLGEVSLLEIDAMIAQNESD